MAGNQVELVRPRSSGEILDDAGRLALAEAPLLLALAGLFMAPAAALLLLTLTLPAPDTFWAQCLLPAAVALTWPLTGLSSAACQEAFRWRAEGRMPQPGACLRGACRLGLRHVAVRALVLALALPCLAVFLVPLTLIPDRPSLLILVTLGLLVLVLPLAWAVLTATATAHPILATGELGWTAALGAAWREAQRNFAKVAVVTFSRFLVLVLVVINLFLVLHAVLWIGDTLAGFDLTYLTLLLRPTNPAFVLSLLLLAWLGLAPFTEAANYLLHVDARARYEGLDLWYRAQRLLPTIARGRVGAMLLALSVVLLTLGPVRADARLDAVRQARQELGQVIQEVRTADPYADLGPWNHRLRRLGERLEREGPGRPDGFRWFGEAVRELPGGDRDAAVKGLQDLEGRLALVEENLARRAEGGPAPTRSRMAIKSLLPPEQEPAPRPKPPPTKPEQPPPPPERFEDMPAPRERGPGLVPPISGEGLGAILWVLLAGLLAAVIAVAARLWWLHRSPRIPKEPTRVEVEQASLEAILTRPDLHPVESLWRQADEQARAGRFLDAVRTLYLAVLALLHRSNLIRYERTRTNGEYLDQLRSRPALQQPFRGLTGIFERKWYGERSCQQDDYGSCRGLAEELRQGVQGET